MTNYNYEMLYKSFLFGLRVAEIMGVKWFGQPVGLGIGQDIIERKVNFAYSWVVRGIITIDKAKEIYDAYYNDIDTSKIISSDEEKGVVFDYTFTEKDFNDAKQAFYKIYECKIPDIKR